MIGAGITGLSIAYHLLEHGLSVVIIDRSGIAAGASGVQPGGVRQQWATRVNCLLARESLAFYRDLGDRLGTRLRPRFSPCGYAFIAHSDARLQELDAAVHLQQELGIPSRLLSPGETAEVVPELDPSSVRGAAWCDEDGYFDRAQEPVEAFAEAALGRGAELVIADVEALDRDGSGWRLRTRSGSGRRVERVVVAAACDTRSILRTVGVELPIVSELRYLFLSEPIRERLLEPLVVANEIGFAAKQLADGRVLASDLTARADPDEGRARWRRTVRAGIESLLPRLEAVSFPHLVEGVYDVTPDHNPILGAVPAADRVWLAAGFSGHGFMIAPAVGRILADAVAGAGEHPWLAELGLARFDRDDAVAETQIV